MIAPVSFALLLLACAQENPVDDNAVAPADELAGDESARQLTAPANATAAEAAQQAALPAATGGLGWTYRQPDRAALFGPVGNPAFSIQCQKPREGQAQLIFTRFLPPTADGQATLSFTGNGQVASLPISAVSNPDGIGGHWRAMVPPDKHAREVAETFDGPGAIEISFGGTPPLVAPSSGEPRSVFADCLSG